MRFHTARVTSGGCDPAESAANVRCAPKRDHRDTHTHAHWGPSMENLREHLQQGVPVE